MTGPWHRLCRATQSARAWRRDRMIERRAAGIVADQAARVAGPDRPEAPEPATMEVQVPRAELISARVEIVRPRIPPHLNKAGKSYSTRDDYQR